MSTIRSASSPNWNPLALNLEYICIFLPSHYHLMPCGRFTTADTFIPRGSNRTRFRLRSPGAIWSRLREPVVGKPLRF